MILTRCLLTLLGIIALKSTEAECIDRVKRQPGELALDVISCDLADSDADRAARCIAGSPFRRFRSGSDADLIAKYFMGNGLGGLGSLLGSAKSQTGEAASASDDSKSSGTAENVGASMKCSGTNSDLDSTLVGAPNQFSGANPISGQLMDFGPLLGAGSTWIQPGTMLAIGNGMQGAGTQGLLGQQSPSSMSTSTNHNYETDLMHTNFVGSPHQNTVGDSYGSYPAGTMVGMAPYPYFVGAANPVQLQDGSQIPLTQSYLYNYNSMVGAQNPLFTETNYVGSSPFQNCPMSLVGASNPQLSRPAAIPESSLDESAKAAKELLGQTNPNSSLKAKKSTGFQDKTDELESISYNADKPILTSKQIIKNLKSDPVNREESDDQTFHSSNHSMKKRLSRFRPIENDAQSKAVNDM